MLLSSTWVHFDRKKRWVNNSCIACMMGLVEEMALHWILENGFVLLPLMIKCALDSFLVFKN